VLVGARDQEPGQFASGQFISQCNKTVADRWQAVALLQQQKLIAKALQPRSLHPVSLGCQKRDPVIMGFTDDVIVRVEGNVNRSRIDVRSASRYGLVDFGQNATRVRRFLAELKARSETTSPQIAGRRGLRSTRAGAMTKRAKDKLPEKAASRTERDRAQSSAQRARAQKETPR
jgi:hypothetical protein